MTATGVVGALQVASVAAYVAIGRLTVGDWLATCDRGRMF